MAPKYPVDPKQSVQLVLLDVCSIDSFMQGVLTVPDCCFERKCASDMTL